MFIHVTYTYIKYVNLSLNTYLEDSFRILFLNTCKEYLVVRNISVHSCKSMRNTPEEDFFGKHIDNTFE